MLWYSVELLFVKFIDVDNTFSVNTSKTVFFILSNHPVSLSPFLRDPSADLASLTDSSLATTFSGILYKKRRKKLQGTSPGKNTSLILAMQNDTLHCLCLQGNYHTRLALIIQCSEEQSRWPWQH